MSSFRIRPHFELSLEGAPAVTRERILRAVAEQSGWIEVHDFPGFVGLHVPEKDRRFWSPRLFLSLEPAPHGGTNVVGTYGPEIEVWSVFLYGYLVSGLLGTFSAIFGGAQLFVEAHAWGFYITGAMAIVAAALYLAAQLGQKFGARQTFELHQACEKALGRKIEIT